MNLMNLFDPVEIYLKFREDKKPVVKIYNLAGADNKDYECFFYSGKKSNGNTLTDDEWIEIFERDKAAGIRYAILGGGEPGLRPVLIDYANNIFENMLILSGGTAPIEPYLKRRIFVGIEGPEKIHDAIKGEGHFLKVLENIEDDRRVVVLGTLTSRNYHYVKEIFEIAHFASVRGVAFTLYTSPDPADPLLLKPNQLKETIELLHEVNNEEHEFVLLSKKMINLMAEKTDIDDCLLKKGLVESVTSDNKTRKPCVFGSDLSCNNCGFMVRTMLHGMHNADPETILNGSRMFIH